MSNEISKKLEELHLDLAKDLLKRIKSGEASPGELNAARQFLKDNGVEAVPTPENPLGELADKIPEFDSSETLVQ